MILVENYNQDLSIVTESCEGGKKKHIVEGVFAQANKRLRNPHTYPRPLMEREVDFFTKTFIETGTAFGELGHRDKLNLEEKNIAIHVDSLQWDGDNVLGRATILNNKNGQIYLSMCEAGKPGVSTRGGGSLRRGIVQDDFRLLYWDAVGRPSADSVMKLMTENWELLDLDEISADEFKQIINNSKDRSKVIKENIEKWFTKLMNEKYKI